EEGYNHLYWITATEINNDHFEIEKSIDGVLFHKIGSTNGSGNSLSQLSYEFNDNNPSLGINYYRLRQVDFDGKFKYSNVISIKQSYGAEISIFPNPTQGKLNLNVVSRESGNYTIIISDVFKTIHKESMFIDKGNHVIRLNYFNTVSAGFYLIKVINENGETITHQKVIKK
ncbi:MAG: T9SS type A sorting domain-containing protein, partial [Flavobacteriales bacterium]|nr:T9SS type A sorting domain-containing protein [Flavobacteriales bacterium]